VIDCYAQALRRNAGKLILVGVRQPVYLQLRRAGIRAELREENVYPATRALGESAYQAWLGGQAGLVETKSRLKQEQTCNAE
jgi:hypothetical protein